MALVGLFLGPVVIFLVTLGLYSFAGWVGEWMPWRVKRIAAPIITYGLWLLFWAVLLGH